MQSIINFALLYIIFYHKKMTASTSPVSKVGICTMIIWESDEIKCRTPNFVTLRKNNILRLKHWWRAKWSWTIASHILYRLQYRKIKWGLLNKVGSKKIFSLKSMTKLEDLTVHIVRGKHCRQIIIFLLFICNINVGHKNL